MGCGRNRHRSANTVTSSTVSWSAGASSIRTSQVPSCLETEQKTATGGSHEALQWGELRNAAVCCLRVCAAQQCAVRIVGKNLSGFSFLALAP